MHLLKVIEADAFSAGLDLPAADDDGLPVVLVDIQRDRCRWTVRKLKARFPLPR
jgi:hypothetical protein